MAGGSIFLGNICNVLYEVSKHEKAGLIVHLSRAALVSSCLFTKQEILPACVSGFVGEAIFYSHSSGGGFYQASYEQRISIIK